MFMKCISALLILSCVVTPCRGDVIILKNGKEFRGELNNKNALHLNPLSVEKITILLEKIGSRESKLVTFDACDVDKIILEILKGKQIIDLESLRQQSFAKMNPEIQQGGNIEQGTSAEIPGNPGHSETEITPESEDVHGNGIWLDEKKRGIALAGGGFLALSIGALAGFGDDGHLNSANYVFIGIGVTLMSYGIFKLLQTHSRPSKSIVQLDVGQKDIIGLSIRWRF
jgi:hypothetical protein